MGLFSRNKNNNSAETTNVAKVEDSFRLKISGRIDTFDYDRTTPYTPIHQNGYFEFKEDGLFVKYGDEDHFFSYKNITTNKGLETINDNTQYAVVYKCENKSNVNSVVMLLIDRKKPKVYGGYRKVFELTASGNQYKQDVIDKKMAYVTKKTEENILEEVALWNKNESLKKEFITQCKNIINDYKRADKATDPNAVQKGNVVFTYDNNKIMITEKIGFLEAQELEYMLLKNNITERNVIVKGIPTNRDLDSYYLVSPGIFSKFQYNYSDLRRLLLEPKKMMIEVDKVIYYEEKGQVFDKQIVTSSGGGVNVAGAIVGDMLFGTAGAILGGRRPTRINTSYVKQDERYIELYYYTEEGEIAMLPLPHGLYGTFKQYIPNKDYKIVSLNTPGSLATPKQEQLPDNSSSALDKIKELKQMLEMELITQDEFDKKKQEILSNM